MPYEIYLTQGLDEAFVQNTKTLDEALNFVERHHEDGSFAIKKPDGTWYQWEADTEG